MIELSSETESCTPVKPKPRRIKQELTEKRYDGMHLKPATYVAQFCNDNLLFRQLWPQDGNGEVPIDEVPDDEVPDPVTVSDTVRLESYITVSRFYFSECLSQGA